MDRISKTTCTLYEIILLMVETNGQLLVRYEITWLCTSFKIWMVMLWPIQTPWTIPRKVLLKFHPTEYIRVSSIVKWGYLCQSVYVNTTCKYLYSSSTSKVNMSSFLWNPLEIILTNQKSPIFEVSKMTSTPETTESSIMH